MGVEPPILAPEQEPEGFPRSMWDRMGYYVYRLLDPTDDMRTFYVGKGRGNRVFDHARGRKTADDTETTMSLKLEAIDRILASGKQVGYVIHRHGMDEEQAFHVEAALIDAYAGLSNLVVGHGTYRVGMMPVRDIVRQYGLPPFPDQPKHNLVLVKIPKLSHGYQEADIFRLVRYCWRINAARANKADYVVAVHLGRTIGVYKADEWLPATAENFRDGIPGTENEPIPYADNTETTRYGFHGYRAPLDIWNEYVGQHGKAFTDERFLRAQNPIGYINV